MRTWLFAVVFIVLASGRAHAYPQFQLARDVTCTGCHLAPDGGGLLNENGAGVAEQLAWKPTYLNALSLGAISTPDWLKLGGDLRGAAGYVHPGEPSAAAYPMQIDVDAVAASHGFSANVIVGFRSYQEGGSPMHVVWPREHYLMWQQHPDANYGLYIRAGHFMPTYGLRLAEHVVYTQLWGGRPLFHEAYAVAASWVSAAFEVHATGFLHDPYGDPAEKGDGGALYAEARMGTHAAIGAGGKVSASDDETDRYTGLTGKYYIEAADVLLLAEGELVHRKIKAGAGDDFNQLAGYLMAVKPLPANLQLDVGVGHYTQDTRVKGLFRDCLDTNLHFYATSRVEFLFHGRVELLDMGKSPMGGFALAELHYRL